MRRESQSQKEHFYKSKSFDFKIIRKSRLVPDPNRQENQDPDPNKVGSDPQHCVNGAITRVADPLSSNADPHPEVSK